uniref:1-acylglycerol-3-phosphate O-acyltransferase n=1 Tax=Salvator merianae TaxID=96440 RepID=A0A8D0DU13_SALMN
MKKLPAVNLHFRMFLPTVPGLFQILPERCTLVVKKKLLYIFSVGMAGWLSSFIFIDHKTKAAEADVMSEAANTMIQKQLRIWMFSEDSRNSNSASLLPLRHGAFHLAVKAQVPVIPVVISSYQTFLNKKIKRFLSGEVTIQILSPMKTKGLSPADVPEFADCVQKAMFSTLNEISGSGGKQESITKLTSCPALLKYDP